MTSAPSRAARRAFSPSLLVAAALILGACGGGSGDGMTSGSASGPSPNGTGSDPIDVPASFEEPVAGTSRDTSLPLNPSLPGTFLVFDEEDEAYRMDPRTGRAVRLAPESWREIRNGSRGFAVYPVSTDPGDGFIVVEGGCEGVLSGVDCLYLQDADALTHTSYRFDAVITSAVRRSPSGRYLAFFSSTGFGTRDLDSLEVILAADGQSVDFFQFNDGERRWFDWIAGDRLVYVDDTRRNLFLPREIPVERGSSPAISVPAAFLGAISDVAVSPTGTRIAFTLESPTAAGGIRYEFWLTSNVVDGEPVSLRKIAETAAIEDRSVLRWSLHGWSPDETMLMLSNVSSGRTELGSAGTKLYTLPTDAPDVLDVSTLPGERSATVRPVYRFSRPFDIGSTAQVSDFSPGTFVWQE